MEFIHAWRCFGKKMDKHGTKQELKSGRKRPKSSSQGPCARSNRAHGWRILSGPEGTDRAHGQAVFSSCELTHFLLFLGIEAKTTSGEVKGEVLHTE